MKQTKLFHSNFRDVSHFFTRKKLFEKNFSRWMSAKKLVSEGAASCKRLQKTGISVGNSHTSVASDWTYRCFHVRNNIVRSFDWLELICVWKFTTAFWWVFTVEPRHTTTPLFRPLFCGPNKSPLIFLSENPVNPTTPLLRPTTTFGSPESSFSL